MPSPVHISGLAFSSLECPSPSLPQKRSTVRCWYGHMFRFDDFISLVVSAEIFALMEPDCLQTTEAGAGF
jgi:hypothetical protein